jgi:hypothetical protein
VRLTCGCRAVVLWLFVLRLPCLVFGGCLAAVVSCGVVSYRVVSCRVVSCRVVSCRVLPCLALPCLVLSCLCLCRVLSGRVRLSDCLVVFSDCLVSSCLGLCQYQAPKDDKVTSKKTDKVPKDDKKAAAKKADDGKPKEAKGVDVSMIDLRVGKIVKVWP